MSDLLKLSFRVSLVFILMIISSTASSQATGGSLTFKVTTSSYNGNYSPKHVLSIWIEDANGFVKTSKLRGDRRKQYLYTWNNRSSGNTADAVTGSTLSSHQAHTITWDGTDLSGNIVPDGVYKVRVEFAEEHAQGPLYALTFTKGTDIISLSPANETRFKNINLLWEPVVPDPPEAAFSYVADDLTVSFTNNSTNADSYNWDFGDSQTSSEENPVHTYAEAGTYSVVLEAIAGDSVASAEKDITVSTVLVEVPEAAFSYTAEDLTVTFTNSSANAESFSWDFGDSQTSSEMNPIHTYAEAGTYTVVLEAIAGDSIDSTEQHVTVTASTVGISYKESMISVFPVPAHNQLIVDLDGETIISGYEIVSLDGRKLRDINITTAQRVIIGIDDLDKGSYLLILNSQKDDFVIQFLKQ